MRILIICMLLIIANAKVTNEDILKKLNELDKKYILLDKKIDTKFMILDKKIEMLRKEMNLRFEAVDKRFEAVDKRFEAVDKRFEDINKRFEDMNKRFEDMNKRFEMMNENMNKRFEAVDKRFEFISNILSAMVAGIFGLIGFMIWDRNSSIQKAREKTKQDCQKYISEIDLKKADKDYVSKIVKAINEVLATDEHAKNIFHRYGLV